MENKKPGIKLIIDPCEECFHSKVCLMKKGTQEILKNVQTVLDNETKVQYAIFGLGKSRIGVVLLNADGTPQLATDEELK